MALYDTADLVDRFKRQSKTPANTASIDDTDIYRYLTDAQLYWLGQFMNHFPRLHWDVWEKMTAASDNKSYSFSKRPLGVVEIYPSPKAPYPLRAGAPWDHSADFFWKGEQTIVIPGDVPRVFANGPYARYVPRPEDIDETTDPILLPEETRKLMLYTALSEWAREGGLEDPSRYEDMIDGLWLGKRPGDAGLLGTLKKRFGSNSSGMAPPWYKNVDMSDLPVATG